MTPVSCQEALLRLYEFLDGELDARSAQEIRRHIELCVGCHPKVKLATEFHDALHRAARGQPVCPESLRKKVGEMLREEQARGTAGGKGERPQA
jgi:anti-sigma factor (TIGR02949 family)